MFEGNTTTVIEMKRAIVGQKKLDKAAGDFDLSLKDFVTGEGVFGSCAGLSVWNLVTIKSISSLKSDHCKLQ